MMSAHSRRPDPNQLACEVEVGTHVLICDEPAAVGGNDRGPTPHDLFDAALAACTSLTVTLYARRKGWTVEDVRVTITRDDREERNGVYRLQRRIEFIGALNDEQRQRLMEIAERCPIHRLMHAKIEITSLSG